MINFRSLRHWARCRWSGPSFSYRQPWSRVLPHSGYWITSTEPRIFLSRGIQLRCTLSTGYGASLVDSASSILIDHLGRCIPVLFQRLNGILRRMGLVVGRITSCCKHCGPPGSNSLHWYDRFRHWYFHKWLVFSSSEFSRKRSLTANLLLKAHDFEERKLMI